VWATLPEEEKVEKKGREEEIGGLGGRGGDYLQRRKDEGIYPF